MAKGGVVQEAGGGIVTVWVDRDLESYPRPGSRVSFVKGSCPEGHGCMACAMKRAFEPLTRLGQAFARANARNRYVDEGWAPVLGPGTDVVVPDPVPAL